MVKPIPFTVYGPDQETDFQIVLRISIGAGEMCVVADALKWTLPERRKVFLTDDMPSIDKLWGEASSSANQAARAHGFTMKQLKDALHAVEHSPETPLASIRDKTQAMNILDGAIERLEMAHRILETSDKMRDSNERG